jgi:uncharacterized membrane protein
MYTQPAKINNDGEIVGSYNDVNDVWHGFLRDALGNMTTFDPVGSAGTFANSISKDGKIVGVYEDSGSVSHGFIRDTQGNFTTFDAPGAGTGQYQGTIGDDINSGGIIIGRFFASDNTFHGFIRDESGNFTDFDPPGAQGTFAFGINDAGQIVGTEERSSKPLQLGFVRDTAGNYAIFDVPGASGSGTADQAINSKGTTTGYYVDSKNIAHGFIRYW